MKIIVFSPANNVHTHKWLDFYNKKGYDVLNVSFSNHKEEKQKQWNNVRTKYLHLKFNSKTAYFFTIGQLKRILEREKPDILHAHYVSSYGLIAALTNFHPFVVSVWGSDIYDFPKENLANKKMVQYTLKKADAICSTSNVMKEETNQYTAKDIVVTPFGVDINKFKPLQRENNKQQTVIGIVKAMKEKYGIEYLIRAYHKFINSQSGNNSETKLVVVGEGPLLDDYRKLVEDMNLNERVEFTGKIPHEEVPAMINQFDIFVVPSILDSESFGVAAVEAQACGVPVVVSNVGGLPEVMIEGKTGFSVPKKDVDSLAEKINLLVNDEDLRLSLGRNAREHAVNTYNWEDNAEIMVRLYKELLDR